MERNIWIKAQASQGNGNCVEVMETDSGFLVRDSKNPAGPVLSFTEGEWSAFLAGATNGEFNRS